MTMTRFFLTLQKNGSAFSFSDDRPMVTGNPPSPELKEWGKRNREALRHYGRLISEARTLAVYIDDESRSFDERVLRAAEFNHLLDTISSLEREDRS